MIFATKSGTDPMFHCVFVEGHWWPDHRHGCVHHAVEALQGHVLGGHHRFLPPVDRRSVPDGTDCVCQRALWHVRVIFPLDFGAGLCMFSKYVVYVFECVVSTRHVFELKVSFALRKAKVAALRMSEVPLTEQSRCSHTDVYLTLDTAHKTRYFDES